MTTKMLLSYDNDHGDWAIEMAADDLIQLERTRDRAAAARADPKRNQHRSTDETERLSQEYLKVFERLFSKVPQKHRLYKLAVMVSKRIERSLNNERLTRENIRKWRTDFNNAFNKFKSEQFELVRTAAQTTIDILDLTSQQKARAKDVVDKILLKECHACCLELKDSVYDSLRDVLTEQQQQTLAGAMQTVIDSDVPASTGPTSSGRNEEKHQS